MTKFKDVAHLYLGCKCICNAQEDDMPIDYIGVLERIDRTDDEFVITVGKHEYYLQSKTVDEDDVKPFLRPLSSMTEEEFAHMKALGWTGCVSVKHWRKTPSSLSYQPAQFVWLLSKSFDLFGLIDSGEAIDATKEGI